MPFVFGAGSFLLFLSLAVNVIALLVPYWYIVKVLGTNDLNFGLWGSCTCRWYYSSLGSAIDDRTVKDWYKSAQWLYAVAVIMIFLVSSMMFISACVTDRAYVAVTRAAGVLMIMAAVLIAVAIILFGIKGKSDYGLALSGNLRFDWGLWMGVAGVGVSVISAIFFLVQGGRRDYQLK